MPDLLGSLRSTAVEHVLRDGARLRAVERSGLLAVQPLLGARRWAERARRAVGAPVASVSGIGAEEQVVHASIGLPATAAGTRRARADSVCQHVVAHGDALAVRDALTVPALADSPLVRQLGLRAYLGVPITVEEHAVGVLCVAAPQPRAWGDEDVARIADLADALSAQLALQLAREELRRRESLLAATLEELQAMRDANAVAGLAPGARSGLVLPSAPANGHAAGARTAPADDRRMRLEHALRSALEDGGLRLAAQPLFGCSDGRLRGAEALLRWTDPKLGEIGPAEFVPIAEQTGTIDAIGRWVVREACRAMAELDAVLPEPLRLGVNVSPRQLLHPAFADAVGEALDAHGLAPDRLVLEITETALLGHDAATERTLAALREIGATLVLDDFGTGFSSLSMLKDRPIDGIKIDRSFVRGLPDDPTSAAIVSGVVGMARALGRTVTAEGIETPEQLAHLQELGCDFAQGYLLGRPAPFADLVAAAAGHGRR